jgi:DNA modification methylase
MTGFMTEGASSMTSGKEKEPIGTLKSPLTYDFRRICRGHVPSTTYATHGMHAFPARFIPQIPHFFIRNYSETRDTILDPFCGSGTTLVEAQILGRNSMGADISPLARLVTVVKSTPIRPDQLRSTARRLLKRVKDFRGDRLDVEFPNRTYWFDSDVIKDLEIIRTSVDGIEEKTLRDFFRVCFSSIIRRVSRADPDIWQPLITKNMRRVIERGRRIQTMQVFEKAVLSSIEGMSEFYGLVSSGVKSGEIRAEVIGGDAKSLDTKSREVQLIITSPPYINAHEYIRTHKLEMLWLGLVNADEIRRLQKEIIGNEYVLKRDYDHFHEFGLPELDETMGKIYRKDKLRAYVVYKYFEDMKKCILECHRVLGHGGVFCLTVGDNTIRGVQVGVHNFLANIAADAGFSSIGVGVDRIRNRALATKRHFTEAYIDVEWMLLFRK